MADADTRQAACGCGQLQVTTTGDPDIVIACSCFACQRRTGSPFGVGAYFRKEAVATDGEAKVFTRVADSGLSVSLRFCPECGTNLYWTADLRPDHYGVAVGGFGELGFGAPDRAVWTENKHPWVRFPDGLPAFDKGSPPPTPEQP